MNLTDLEKKVIDAYKKDDIVRDRGWEDEGSATWVKDFHKSCGMDGKTFSGVMSSLVAKGVIATNGDSFKLTDLGRKVAADLESRPAFIDYGTINFTPPNAPVRKALEKCNSLGHGHLRTYETAGRCIERITCKICGYTLEIDSSD